MYIQSVNIGYVIDYIVKERESLNVQTAQYRRLLLVMEC